MQTFLPYEGFSASAQVLDRQRLGKQRVEAYQILRMLLGETDGGSWRKHPAVLMWAGYEPALAEYGRVICQEWRARGYKDQMLGKFDDLVFEHDLAPVVAPPWLGDPGLHLSMQSNLVRKDPGHYRPEFGDDLPDDLEYAWPVLAA